MACFSRVGQYPLPRPMVWFRGLADDLPLQQWLTEFIFPAEGGGLDAEKVYRGALLAAAEMMRGGITPVADGFFLGRGAPGLKRRRPSGRGSPGVVDFPAPAGTGPRPEPGSGRGVSGHGADYLDRLTSGVFCHSPYTCGPKPCKKPRT